jgi:hypothetical protein
MKVGDARMSVELNTLGELVAEQMAAIEADLDEGSVEVVCSVVGVVGPNGEQNVRVRSNVLPATQLQVLAAAQQLAANGNAELWAQQQSPEPPEQGEQ